MQQVKPNPSYPAIETIPLRHCLACQKSLSQRAIRLSLALPIKSVASKPTWSTASPRQAQTTSLRNRKQERHSPLTLTSLKTGIGITRTAEPRTWRKGPPTPTSLPLFKVKAH
uniref:Uncharacterized protein n=1 Tax=Vibrio harveyi TaxID=669 RepID=E5G5Q9_VIBHA|nr:hypothetical protein [Vibrio harveyi]